MVFDQSLKTHFQTKGWVVVEGVFSADRIDQTIKLAMDCCRTQVDGGDSYAFDSAEDGTAAHPRKVDEPFLVEPRIRAFVLDVKLVGLVGELLGAAPLLFNDQIFMKPPRVGSEKPFHQDNFYFQLEPADQVITAWIALDDVDEENGCLRYIDGSHLELLPHEPLPDQPYNLMPSAEMIDLSKQSLALVRKGGVVFHHSQTLHTSGRNRSDRWRRAHATHWVTANVRDNQNAQGQLAKSYFNRPDLAALLSSTDA